MRALQASTNTSTAEFFWKESPLFSCKDKNTRDKGPLWKSESHSMLSGLSIKQNLRRSPWLRSHATNLTPDPDAFIPRPESSWEKSSVKVKNFPLAPCRPIDLNCPSDQCPSSFTKWTALILRPLLCCSHQVSWALLLFPDPQSWSSKANSTNSHLETPWLHLSSHLLQAILSALVSTWFGVPQVPVWLESQAQDDITEGAGELLRPGLGGPWDVGNPALGRNYDTLSRTLEFS